MKLMVKLARRADGSYVAWVPALPGCRAGGATREEAQAAIQRAVEGYLCSFDVALPRELGRMMRSEAVPAAG